jgi:hypothetical protein
MWAVEVVVMEEEGEEGGAVGAGVIGAGIGPFAGEGLDEAFGLAIGLGTVGAGEEVAEAELVAGGGEEFGAVGGAAVGEDALEGDAVGLVEVEGEAEGGEDAGGLFIWEEGGEGQAAVIINGDVEGLGAGAGVALGAVAGGTDPGLVKTAQFLDIQMEEITWGGVFVADDRWLGRFEGAEAVEAVTTEDAGEGGF